MDPRMARSWTPGWPDHGPPDGPIMAPTWPFMAFLHPTCSCCPGELSSTSDPSSARLTHHAVPISPVTPASAVMYPCCRASTRRWPGSRKSSSQWRGAETLVVDEDLRARGIRGRRISPAKRRRGLPALPAPGVHLQERDGDHGGGAFLPRPARALRRRARSAERGGEARSWGSDASKSWRRRRGGGRPALLPPSRSESDFRQIRVGLPNRARVGLSIVRRPFPRSGPGAGGQADPRCGSGWGSPFEVAKKPLRGHFRGQCRDSCGGSAGAVAGARILGGAG